MKLSTRVRSLAMRHFSREEYLEKLRAKGRKDSRKRGEPPTVHYFHQADDPYSHLAVQKLALLRERYELTFKYHLVPPPEPEYQGSATHFRQWARADARSVANDYGVHFDPVHDLPAETQVADAQNTLAEALNAPDFASIAKTVGDSLWSSSVSDSPRELSATARNTLASGATLRSALGHYQGAMFYFEGEWFWGLDRLRSLEQRLNDEGFDRAGGPPSVPQPMPDTVHTPDVEGVVLEYYPSLRSPYTAVGHQRVLDMINRTGVTVEVRPVMPMLMRGIPAPRAKQRYIITDSAREGRAFGAPFGRIVDPFGEPVRRAFKLFAGAAHLQNSMAFVTSYLQAAWFEGTDISGDKGLMRVVERCGLEWSDVQKAAASLDWEAQLASNLQRMLDCNLWGVPSFRVRGGNTTDAFACWGQDRIWRVESEILRRGSPS